MIKLRYFSFQGSALFWQFRTPKGPVHPKFRRYIECPVAYGTQWGTVVHIVMIYAYKYK